MTNFLYNHRAHVRRQFWIVLFLSHLPLEMPYVQVLQQYQPSKLTIGMIYEEKLRAFNTC